MRALLLRQANARPCLGRWFHAAALVMVLLVGAEASAQMANTPPRSGFLAIRRHAVMPVPGWIRFCRHRPDECAVGSSEPATIALTPQGWEALTRINRQVNAGIRPITDQEHWGVADRWDLAEDGYGDCEDFQLVKRKRLVAAGLPRRALRMTAVIDRDGAPHSVLMARTDQGDFILDNKRDAVLPWRQTGYVFLQREGGTGSTWVSLGAAPALPVRTAGR
ncbi:transglutaminase-like cysteine peptidase [Microvirga sesbaniae]|uniref:transglutaminase-like cysteine peptidase n=1 Tax=Microvirga sesbaniae TaxID=681392 RepID=UPI00358DD747